MSDRWRWWAVALLPKFVARSLWVSYWVPLGSWGPYILGQALGQRGTAVSEEAA